MAGEAWSRVGDRGGLGNVSRMQRGESESDSSKDSDVQRSMEDAPSRALASLEYPPWFFPSVEVQRSMEDAPSKRLALLEHPSWFFLSVEAAGTPGWRRAEWTSSTGPITNMGFALFG